MSRNVLFYNSLICPYFFLLGASVLYTLSGSKIYKHLLFQMILSSCSAYFEELLNNLSPTHHPIIFLRGISYWAIKAITDFMYVGEVNIDQNKLQELLDVAELLKVIETLGECDNFYDLATPDKGIDW